MQSLSGIISDKLRSLMTKDQILNNPRPPEAKRMPAKGVHGQPLGGKPGRKTKK